MNTRRKFLLQGGMATTALISAKPFESIANALAPVTGFSVNNNKIVLAHTGDNINVNNQTTLQQVRKLKKNTGNLVVLHAGNNSTPQFNYDASLHTGERFSIAAGDYKIIYKGDIKIGVISATINAAADRINTTAAYLKKEKNCHLVVCLSQLGYKTNGALDDLSLAEGSTAIDIIIGGHAKNFCKLPRTIFNKNREDVIINHSADNELALRKIEIDFDDFGHKKHIALTRTIARTDIA